MAKDEEYKFPDEIETKADKEEKVEYEIEGDGAVRKGMLWPWGRVRAG